MKRPQISYTPMRPLGKLLFYVTSFTPLPANSTLLLSEDSRESSRLYGDAAVRALRNDV